MASDLRLRPVISSHVFLRLHADFALANACLAGVDMEHASPSQGLGLFQGLPLIGQVLA